MSKSVAIVTGASQGIGRATAIRLAKDFSAITLVARDRKNLDETAAAITAAGAKSLVLDLISRKFQPPNKSPIRRSRPSVRSMPCLISQAQYRRSICSR